jgi:membrane protease subunit HflK
MSRRKINAAFSPHDVLAALRSSIAILSWAMGVLIVVYLTSGITTIAPNEAGLVFRFGKLLPESHPPGLMFALPAPIDEVVKVPVKSVQEVSLGLWASGDGTQAAGTLNPVSQPYTLTSDTNIICATFAVRYQVSDPADYLLGAADRDGLRDAVLYKAACHVLATMNVEDALTVGKNYVAAEAAREAQEDMDRFHLGIRVLAFETREINPPAAVLAAFQAVVSAKVQAKTEIEEANAYAATTIPAAKADAYRAIQDADSYAHQTVARAEGESAAFTSLLHEYKANPALVRTRLQAEMLTAVMPKVRISTLMPAGRGTVRMLLSPHIGNGNAYLQTGGQDSFSSPFSSAGGK